MPPSSRSPRRARAAVLPAAVLAVALALVGCGGAGAAGPGTAGTAAVTPPAATPPAPATPDARAVDVAYVQAMMPHHEQALELSAIADATAPVSPEVADLAFRIDREQVEEIGQMQGVERLLGDPGGAAGMFAMSGMADPATLARLRSTRGPEFDRLWLQTMVAHHRGAIEMARQHLAATGPGSVLTDFSRTLIRTQQAEIDRMTALLAA